MNGTNLDSSDAVQLTIRLSTDEAVDEQECENLVWQLWHQLSELDLDSIGIERSGSVPVGAKAADPVTLGVVVLALTTSGGVLPLLIETLREWLVRRSDRHHISITIADDTLELERATAQERRDLVEAFIRQHSTK
jgi:hypothetical protein